MSRLEEYFESFRNHIIGIDQHFESPFGKKKIIYADWTASGRLYRPIEKLICDDIGAFVANTHTETSITGSSMTHAYNVAKSIIKNHVNARSSDVLISSNSGMTGVVNKFQRILGLKIHEKFRPKIHLKKEECPVIFVTHMEHHSNQTSWMETIGTVKIIQATPSGEVDLDHLRKMIAEHDDCPIKIAAVTSCSNVTGIMTPYHDIAEEMHNAGGYCFVDFACSAPYIEIDMNPADRPQAYLDAIYFSPHKFLGGPGSSGILIFRKELYKNEIPDVSGGGTVDWTNPWGEHKYLESIEAREDGGTPSFLQTMKVALCIQLKERMGIENIADREKELLEIIWPRLKAISNLIVLADCCPNRLPVISFYIDGLHYNLGVKLLNDRFGIQVRGGCSCAGTYGHYLLEMSYEGSKAITNQIDQGDLTHKPGWIRLSLHPTTSNEDLDFIINALEELSENHEEWAKDYHHCSKTNEFRYTSCEQKETDFVESWFNMI